MTKLKAARTVYLAGKIAKNDWRHRIVSGLRDVSGRDYDLPATAWPVLRCCIAGRHHYSGPFFISCDHGCAHGDNKHGAAATADGCCPDCDDQHGMSGCIEVDSRGLQKQRVVQLCLDGIVLCDLFFAWIDASDCFGTIAELGYAKAQGKRIVVGLSRPFQDMWFASQMADEVIDAPSPEFALAYALNL